MKTPASHSTRALNVLKKNVSTASKNRMFRLVWQPRENGYAERLIRTIKEKEVYLSENINFADARTQIGRFLAVVYMTKRIQSSLGKLKPVEFKSA